MSDAHVNILTSKIAVLTQTLTLDDVVDELIGRRVLTFDERHQIYRSDASFREQVEEFIVRLIRKPDSAFYHLIEVLRMKGQDHVANELENEDSIR